MTRNGTKTRLSRRNVIRGVGAAGIAGLAGCLSGGGGNGSGGNGSGGNGSGGNGSGGGTDQVTIEFWDYFGGTEDAELKSLVSEFEKRNPSISVNVQAVPFNNVISKLKTASATGNAPHVVSYWMSFSTFFWEQGLLDPIDEYLENGLEPYFDIVKPAAKAGGDSGNKNVVALPMDVHAKMVCTNNTVLEEAGAPTDVTTNSKFREAANAVKKNTDARPFFLQINPNPLAGFRSYYSLIRQHGGQMVKDGEPVYKKTGAGNNAAKWMDNVTGKWNWDKPNDLSDENIRINQFKNNEAGMAFLGNWGANNFQNKQNEWIDLDFTYHPPWGMGGQTKKTFCESNGLFFPSNSGHTKAEKRARVKFVTYITQNNPQWATKATHLPATRKVATSKKVTNSAIYQKYGIVKTLAQMAKKDQLRYQPRTTANLYAPEIAKPFSAIYAQNTPIKKAITTSANAMSDRLSE